MVRKEIQDETDNMIGRSNQVSQVPDHFNIHSPKGKEIMIYVTLVSCVHWFIFFYLLILYIFVRGAGCNHCS